MIGRNRRKLLQTVDNSFNELYETKQNKVWYSDAEPDASGVEDGDLWISTTSSITPPPIEYRDVDLSNYAANNIPNYMTITELPQDIEEYLSSGIRATNMRRAFYNCRSLKKLDFNKYRIDTSKCSNMFETFEKCTSLTTLDLSSFDTSKVTDMAAMFSGCTSLTTLDLSSFNTSNVNYMPSMFYECSSLTTLDLSSFDTSNVDDMSAMFYGCIKLTEIKGIIDFHNQSDSDYCRDMFTYCPISPSTPVQIKNPPTDSDWWQTAGFTSQDQFIIVS